MDASIPHCYPGPGWPQPTPPPPLCTSGSHYLVPSLPPFFICSLCPASVLTYIPDRLYLAAYHHPPTADTVFPYPEPLQSPRKRSQRTAGPTPVEASQKPVPYYFTVDDILLYNAFHHDFGPLHIGHLYRFALHFHDVLGAKENKDRPIVFWSRADPRSESAPCSSFRMLC